MNGNFRASAASAMNGNSVMNGEFTSDRLFFLTLVKIGTSHRCMTIARSLREAEQRARLHYGFGYELNSWGTRSLPIESRLIGGGYFIRSSRDENHRHSLTMISSLR